MSESKISFKLCDKNPGRVRDIKTHIIREHKKDSYFKCNAKKCNFDCSINFGCFVRHAKREHGEYFEGRESSLEEEEIFSLVIIDSNEKETKHNSTCLLDRDLGKIRKKSEIKRRGELENKIHEKFTKGTEAVNVNVARNYYEGGLSDWRILDKKYPRTYKRQVANSSIKKLGYYVDLCEDLIVDFFE